ncbi:MAG: 4'-phosphopantetheinyl transferase superfamily protein [Lysobacterales bacterium]
MNMPAESTAPCLDSIRLAVGQIMPATVEWQIEAIAAEDLEARAADAGIVAYADDLRPSRRREFLAGRLAARAALQQLGCAQPTVGMADLVPVWPAQYCGSISHSGGLAVAVAGGSPPWLSLGIDIELRMGERRHRVVRGFMAAAEARAVEHSSHPWAWTRAWAAKEAAYKCCSAMGAEVAPEVLSPIWREPDWGVLEILIDGRPVVIELVCRIAGDLIWVLASNRPIQAQTGTR